MITTTLPVTVKKPCTFLLAKEKTWKRIFNANSELSQNRREKQFMPSKTGVNWLYNDIWCYLSSACFDWKIGIFQQAVVRVYYILNWIKAFESLSVDSRVDLLNETLTNIFRNYIPNKKIKFDYLQPPLMT